MPAMGSGGSRAGSASQSALAWLRQPIKSIQVATESIATLDTTAIVNAINTLRVNAVNIPVRYTLTSATDSNPVLDTTTYNNAITAINAVQDQTGCLISLEPYPWISNGTVVETNFSPANPTAFFGTYRTAILSPLAALASKLGCEAMYVASGLQPTEQYETEWANTITYLDERYPGAIMFRTKWMTTISQSAVDAGLWSPADRTTQNAPYLAKLNRPYFGHPGLDLIAWQAYWELTGNASPSEADLIAALRSTTVFNRRQDVLADVEAFYLKWGKPQFFGELGCPALAFGPTQPWSLTPNGDTTASDATQDNFFKAYQAVFGVKDWWRGYSVWQAPFANAYNPVGRAAAATIRRFRRFRVPT